MSRTGATLAKLLFLGSSIAALGALTLSPFFGPDELRGWRAAYAEPQQSGTSSPPSTRARTQWAEAIPTAYRHSQSASPACNGWDISPMAMEAILDEMVRRGWRPPTQGGFLASLYSAGDVVAVDPDAPMPLGPARTNPLLNGAELGEFADPAEADGVPMFETNVPPPAPPRVVEDPAPPDLDVAVEPAPAEPKEPVPALPPAP